MKKIKRQVGMFLIAAIFAQILFMPQNAQASEEKFHSVYANWMQVLYSSIADKPLYDIAMPGTHDSATYYLDKNSWDGINNGFADFIKIEQWPGLKDIIYNFSRTQDYDIYTQLKHGNRYLDIRLKRDKHGIVRGYHGMFGTDMSDIFYQVKKFLNDNPNELVILDLQHLHNLNGNDLNNLNYVINVLLGDKLGTKPVAPSTKFKDIISAGTRAIILTDNSSLLSRNNKFWNRKENVISNWKNTSEINTLMTHLDTDLAASNNEPTKLHVAQMVLSPNLNEIIAPIKGGNIFKLPGLLKRWGSTSIRSLTVPHNERFLNWVETKTKDVLNITMRDFYNPHHIAFTINRNMLQ